MRSVTLIMSLAASPAAGDFLLQTPVDCVLGDSCFIQQFVDQDPTTSAQDFLCGSLTYDGHKGTDFALPDLVAQAAGVNVLAAADGTVTGVRNDMPDALQTTPDAPDVSNRECGNGLVIAHADGHRTQYCHMAQGSVMVAVGQSVEAGDVLGQIGLSGMTQFPHLHFTVWQNNKVIDPFDTNGIQTCGDSDRPDIWHPELATPQGGLIAIGLTDKVPAFDQIKAGLADTGVSANSPAMVGWAHVFGARDGDSIKTTILGPDGFMFTATDQLIRDQARLFRANGKRTPSQGWDKGDYTLNVAYQRGDKILDQDTTTYSVD